MTTEQLYKLLNFYKTEVEGEHNTELLKAEHISATLEKDRLTVNYLSTTDINEYINELEKIMNYEN